MTTVLLIVHLMIAAALVGVVLLQRSEGGALGVGGGGGFMTGRGASHFLKRVRGRLGGAFFAPSVRPPLSRAGLVFCPGGPPARQGSRRRPRAPLPRPSRGRPPAAAASSTSGS